MKTQPYATASRPSRISAVDYKEVGILLAIFLLVWFTWSTNFLWPLKILVVFFHEASHGIMAVLTGGEIVSITLSPEEGGVCISRGGSRFLTLSAGYLGSLCWGSLLLIASRMGVSRIVMGLLGAILGFMTLAFIPVFSFGFVFGMVACLAMAFIAWKLGELPSTWMLKVIGLTSCLYAILDIHDDVISRSHVRSDARMLSEITIFPTLFWGVLWIAIAIGLTAAVLYFVCQKVGPPAPRQPEPRPVP